MQERLIAIEREVEEQVQKQRQEALIRKMQIEEAERSRNDPISDPDLVSYSFWPWIYISIFYILLLF